MKSGFQERRPRHQSDGEPTLCHPSETLSLLNNVTNIRSTKAFFNDFFFGGGEGGQNNLKNEYSIFAGVATAV